MKTTSKSKVCVIAAGIMSVCAALPSRGEGHLMNGSCLTGDFFGSARFGNKGFSFVDGSYLQTFRSKSQSGGSASLDNGRGSAYGTQFFEYSAKGRRLTQAIRLCLPEASSGGHSFSHLSTIVAAAPPSVSLKDEGEPLNFDDTQPQGLVAGPALSPVPEPGNVLAGVMVLGMIFGGGLKSRFARGAKPAAVGTGA